MYEHFKEIREKNPDTKFQYRVIIEREFGIVGTQWVDVDHPIWCTDRRIEYRVKPKDTPR